MPGAVNSIARVSYVSLLVFYALLLLVTAVLDWARFTDKPDILIHDLWARLNKAEPPDDVVIIGIDSTSLQKIGRWPWSRDIQATLVRQITESKAQSLILDILFTEADQASTGNDFMLSQVISENGNVILPILTGEYSAGKINPEKLPIPEITMAVAGLGHVFLPVDPDGIVRRVNLKSGFKSAHWSTLSLSLAEMLGEVPEELPGKRLERSPIMFSWVSDYQVLIPFYGPSGTFKTLSASDVIEGDFETQSLRGKHVFVGVTATGLGDIQPTPVSSNSHPMSGVEVHATIFSALRDQRLVTASDYHLSYLVTAVLVLIVIFFYVRFTPGVGLIASFLLAFVPIIISFLLYVKQQLWYPPLSASIPILLSFPIWSWHRLDFVSRFIQDEINEMDTEIPPISSSATASLVNYLDSAMHHLPIQGWKFISNELVFQNGQTIDKKLPETTAGNWRHFDNHYFKSYQTADKLFIYLNISDVEYADEITFMIDSLSRVRDRRRADSHIDTVERLQIKAQQLSSRMDKLLRINTLSESIFHGSPAGLVVWNMAGEFVRMNELAHTMLPEILGEEPELISFLRSLNKEPGKDDTPLLRELLIEKQSWQIDYDVHGAEKVIDFSVIGQRFADRLMVASIVDVTAIRESERARAEMVEYLSHDLRSPLISSVYLLSTQKELVMEHDTSNLDRIESNINQSLGMIDDLLNLSRADNLKQDELEPVLFDNVVNNSIDQLMPQAQGKSIEIKIRQNEEDDLWVSGNAILLERALVNVIGNAIKYSPKKTTIRISVYAKDHKVVCEVLDQGIGMDEGKISTLFQRFKRSNSVEREYQGSGLGLALVSRVVEQHRGTVAAESPGVGTRVVIELPMLTEEL